MSKKNVEWEWKKLGDVCEIVSGRNQKAVEVPNGKYPIYGSGGEMGRANSFICPAGCTIVGRKGSINNPIFVNEPFWNVDTAFGFSPKKNCNSFFLFYFCKSFDFYSMNKGTTIPSLVKADLLEISIPIPPLDEQERIVKVLDDAFEKIDAIKTTAETNLQNAKDLFQTTIDKIFVECDCYKQDEIGNIFKTGAGGTPLKQHKDYYENGNIPWLRSGEVCQKEIIETEMFITKKGMENSSAKMFPKNTVVVAMYGATAGQVGILRIESTTNQAVCGIFPNESFLSEYVYYCLLNGKEALVAQAVGGAQPNISQIKVKQTKIPLPPLSIQKQIVAKLDSLSEKVKQLESNYKQVLADCDELKKALLKQAFEGML